MSVPLRVLITGGAGFLGRRIIDELRQLARTRDRTVWIRVFDLQPSQEADESVEGDITEPAAVRSACDGVDIVIHAASLIDWGNTPRPRLLSVNVDGTRHVLDGARAQGVAAVIYTSTLDTVMDGRPLLDIDESHPYPQRFLDGYAETKAAAERMVLAAHGQQLRTCSLRPCGMYGEADPYHMDNVLGAARDGKLVARMGSPETVFEHVYVGNVAYAHALAVFEMEQPTPRIGGRAYFVTDRGADNFFDFMQPFAEALGYPFPPRSRSIPRSVAVAAGRVSSFLASAVRPVWALRPTLTHSSATALCTSFSVRSDRLRNDLDYQPRYSESEAFERVTRYYGEHRPA